ncbi:hypothetical protein TVAG_411850 [Trichomonas vaginalis G3]|uniref:Uncharacterized protein n=1 Tax=Trichomonas vaginalis (strain ATCC PRA-98 / G3) TaxID=412133 RepID=A2FB93_TRIV3|nr:hypothetical protein TVAGG3_0995650 [Trichomonas vaginalis G3]EAX97823.1 hypothetical protein TVAG_411850 [Trichomonas vaginalis G3]KAI5490363.1 hypothetical protein TVAGG3_0995650 [Trichomonas vaginalis G3]|eukprot:XP_001310753.1 hypothetical protein [Trichomonas vaginalis G3]
MYILCLEYYGYSVSINRIDTKYCNIINNSKISSSKDPPCTILCEGINATFTNCSFSGNGDEIALFANDRYGNTAEIYVYDSYIDNLGNIVFGAADVTENIQDSYTFFVDQLAKICSKSNKTVCTCNKTTINLPLIHTKQFIMLYQKNK